MNKILDYLEENWWLTWIPASILGIGVVIPNKFLMTFGVAAEMILLMFMAIAHTVRFDDR